MPQVPGNRAELGQNHDARKAVSATLSVLKWNTVVFHFKTERVAETAYSFSLEVKWGYIAAQELDSERIKSFALSISLQTKAMRS